jgi:hypothetical protein
MTDDTSISRRTFLRRFAAGAVAGGGLAAATTPEEPQTPQGGQKERRTPMFQRVAGGALMGGLLTNAVFAAARSKPLHDVPPREVTRRDYEIGRDWEHRRQIYRSDKDEFDRGL